MVVNLRLRSFSSVTQRMYLGCAQRFAAYQSPGADRAGRVRRAGVSRPPCGERHAGRATLGVYVAQLHFFYRATLDHPDVVAAHPVSPAGDRAIAGDPEPGGDRVAPRRRALAYAPRDGMVATERVALRWR